MERALVLNATYEPLSIVPARRAVVLVLHGKATVLEHDDHFWRAESVVAPVPSVLLLNYFVRVPYDRRVPLTRHAVFVRDRHRCQYCKAPAESIDHVVPRSRGGEHSWENVVACCRRCNVRKGNRLLSESGFRLSSAPRAPHRYGWMYASAGPSLDPRWERYLLADSA